MSSLHAQRWLNYKIENSFDFHDLSFECDKALILLVNDKMTIAPSSNAGGWVGRLFFFEQQDTPAP